MPQLGHTKQRTQSRHQKLDVSKMGTQQKGQIREGLEIWQGGRQEVSHSSLEKNLTHFYLNIRMKFGELRATQATSDFYGKVWL